MSRFLFFLCAFLCIADTRCSVDYVPFRALSDIEEGLCLDLLSHFNVKHQNDNASESLRSVLQQGIADFFRFYRSETDLDDCCCVSSFNPPYLRIQCRDLLLEGRYRQGLIIQEENNDASMFICPQVGRWREIHQSVFNIFTALSQEGSAFEASLLILIFYMIKAKSVHSSNWKKSSPVDMPHLEGRVYRLSDLLTAFDA